MATESTLQSSLQVYWGGPRDWATWGLRGETPIFDALWDHLLVGAEIRRYEEEGRIVPPELYSAWSRFTLDRSRPRGHQ